MKNILITGINSYIGVAIEKWLVSKSNKYNVDTIDMKNEVWRQVEFSKYDVVFHVAAVVHQKEKSEMKELYYKVNRDLPLEVANRAKKAGVSQFIFMSTMAVYGLEGRIGEEVVIKPNTQPNPITFYGQSKLEAEIGLVKLNSDSFKVVILRPPMIYGPNCPGNFARLEKVAIKSPVFPLIENKRSMLHIDKLCQYVKEYIDGETEGLYIPQDDEYVNTSLMVKELAEKNGKSIYLSRIVGLLVLLTGKKLKLINKVFGNLIYEK